MKDLYGLAGLTRQGFWKYHQRQQARARVTTRVLELIKAVREGGHSRMGCRAVYWKVRDQSPVGRDIFEQIAHANGYKLKRQRNKRKTTWSQRVDVCSNLVEGLTVTRINQVWQSDIFYHRVGDNHLYIVTIIDVYSRRLLALKAGQTLEAKETVKALKMAIRARGGNIPKGCIFHSDRGSQYISQALKDTLKAWGFRRSMAKLPQENAYAERVQGTILNQYLVDARLDPARPDRALKRLQQLYNTGRPHESLGKMAPSTFEERLETIPKRKRPRMEIFRWNHSYPQNQHSPQKEKRSKKEKA